MDDLGTFCVLVLLMAIPGCVGNAVGEFNMRGEIEKACELDGQYRISETKKLACGAK